MQPGNLPEGSEFHRFFAGETVMDVGKYGFQQNCEFPAVQSFCSSSFYPWESSGITDTPEARALAASKNHKEAEKRRRERINSHLDRLRSLLPCNSRTDKATLLAKVIQRVKELKKQSSETIQLETFPSETDEITVSSSGDCLSDGRLLIRASWCCEDRSDLIPELIQTLKSLRLNPLRAEMVTLGGRIRNILIVAGDKENSDELVHFLKDALKSVVQPLGSDFGGQTKRRRVLRSGPSLSQF
ncbi:transcription factor bHLH106 [Cornus florida]|uniref:transcription factor bHLH106 n=1 Tax=Cornus florida TaxID=4283 RepID=UPI00289CD4C0|nr:transcription factor bHLH106 [Cornus florida]